MPQTHCRTQQASQRNTSSSQLLRQYFPQALAGNTALTLWLVQDAAGNTLRSGELNAGQEFTSLNPDIEAQFGGQRLGPWVIEEVRGARGQPIKLGIARLQYNPANNEDLGAKACGRSHAH